MTARVQEKYWGWIISFFLYLLIAKISASSEREMTVKVEAGQEECFFEQLNSGDTLDVDYQVGRHAQ